MRLSEQRFHFTARAAKLVTYAHGKGLRLVADEGRIISPRKVRIKGEVVKAEDAVHIPKSTHHVGLGADFILYDENWQPIWKYDTRWQLLGNYWKSLSTIGLICTWGGDWAKKDLGHFSINEGV